MTKKSAPHSNDNKLANLPQRIRRPAPPTHGKQARADLKSDRTRARDLQSPTPTQRPFHMLL